MEKQRTVNSVTANDEWSQSLMKMYENWMGGDCFQNSTIKEEEIPTGQKQGGGTGASFTSVNGSLPAIEFDKSTGLPTIPELGVTDETGKKDPKASSTGGEPPTNPQGLKPKYGAQIRNTVLVGANEEAACDTREEGYGKKDKKEKVKKEEVKSEEWKAKAKKVSDKIMSYKK